MPSSITLTVSHLPTSTSFFLSALQPLNYVYRGRSNNTIGFGAAADPSIPTDFWITQEVPGVPAGAAHVAFSAPSRLAVQHFFTAALKAGGKLHGEPALRDTSGYYSSAVIDFDGNSIEAVYRPSLSDEKDNDLRSMASVARTSIKSSTEVKGHAYRPTASVVQSTASRVSPPIEIAASSTTTSGDVLDRLVAGARSAADMARNVVEQARPAGSNTTNPSGNDTIMGTLLGVAAGAALHYAFTNEREQRRPSMTGRSVTEPGPLMRQRTYPDTEAMESYYPEYPRYITMKDDSDSTVLAPRSRRTRRDSSNVIDSGFGPGTSSVSKEPRESSMKMLEAPPTSFKAAVSSYLSGSSSRRSSNSGLTAVPARSMSYTSTAPSRHAPPSDHTVKTAVRRTREQTLQRTTSPLSASTTSKSRAPTSKSRASPTRSVAASSRHHSPSRVPLPPSRANTWADGSTVTRSKAGSSKITFSTQRGKKKVMDEELTPNDSISQISVNTDARSKRSSRRG